MDRYPHPSPPPERAVIEARVLQLAEEFLAAAPGSLRADATWIEVFDSLDETDYILRMEAEFRVSLGPPFASPAAREIAARRPFRLADFTDLIIAQWGSGWGEESKCPECGYSLSGLTGEVCPECGRAIGQSGSRDR